MEADHASKSRVNADNVTAGSERPGRPIISHQDKVRIEFYATYDVMTGVRIAATLGGFFGLMAFLLVCKSRSKSVKALNDPKIVEMAEAAVAEEEAEEEERRLIAALEAVAGEAGLCGARARLSLGDASAGSPRRLGVHRGASLPASTLYFDGRPYASDDPPSGASRYLSIPMSTRRYSSVTCSSSGSSYLERRGSSLVCALPAAPSRGRRAYASPCGRDGQDHCPVDIHVIQATPELSPCASERMVFSNATDGLSRRGSGKRMAPLASIGSCAASLSVDCRDRDCSFGSDSVFFDDEECVDMDTDNEIEQFSTDSDESSNRQDRSAKSRGTKEDSPGRKTKSIVGWSLLTTSLLPGSKASRIPRRHRSFVNKPVSRQSLRRLSHPMIISKPSCATISASVAAALPTEPLCVSKSRIEETPSNYEIELPIRITDTAKVIEERRSQYCRDIERGTEVVAHADETICTELISNMPLPLPLSKYSCSQETLF